MSAADDYFAVADHSYWQWQDNGNVVAWSDGSTIAFRAELLTVYLRLRTCSLPPFGAVVLLLAACRDPWNAPPGRIELLAQLLRFGRRTDRLELLQRVANGLNRVRALDAPLRNSPEAKAELAAMVFERQEEPALPGTYDRLIADLEKGLSEATLHPKRSRIVVDRLLRDLAWLDRGLGRVDGAALALRLRTGLEQSIEPVKVELPSQVASRKLLAELKDHPELGGVARLAQLLLTAVHLPMPLSYPEELPVGGVSDISNRGSLDRLLLSELASDDLTLAVRVAMNEALYLRRELPPRPPPRRRLVLLDSGLRMWGVPRVFATSVGLALAAGAADKTDVDVFRAAGVELAEVDMTTAEGLTKHLAALDHHVHPGAALAALAEEIEASPEAADVVIVTGDDVYADRKFQQLLGELQLSELHIATVARDGGFRLHLQTPRGHKLLRQAQFALDEVLKPSTRPRVPLIEMRSPLPAVFGVDPFPFRLSSPVDVNRSWYVEDFGVLTYTRDGRLLHWTDPYFGAIQLAEGLPPGNLLWAATQVTDGAINAVIGKLSRRGLCLLTVPATGADCKCVRLDLDTEQPKYAFIHQGVVFVGDAARLNACSLNTGQLLTSRLLGERKRFSGRFFATPQRAPHVTLFAAASFNGRESDFTEFYTQSTPRDQLLAVFESPFHEGPMGLLSSGALWNFATTQRRETRRFEPTDELQVYGLSRSGRRILVAVKGSSSTSYTLVDVHTLATTESNWPFIKELEPELFNTARPVMMRHRFKGVGVDAHGRLTLVGRRDTHWPLEYDDKASTWKLPAQPSAVELRVSQPFSLVDESAANRYWLAAAKFADGSRAVLDDRGLLHLKSSGESLPEISLVLVEGLTAGWAADGSCWGSAYFLVDRPAMRHGASPRDLLLGFGERLS